MIATQSDVVTTTMTISLLVNSAALVHQLHLKKKKKKPPIALTLILVLMFMEILAQHGMTPIHHLAITMMMTISSLEINAAPAAVDATLMTAVTLILTLMVMMRKKLMNAQTTILLQILGVILAVHGMTPILKIAVNTTLTLSTLLLCAALVEVVASEVRYALSSNLKMNGPKTQNSAKMMTPLLIHMVTLALNTTIYTQINADYGTLLLSTPTQLAASAQVVMSTKMVNA